MAERRFDSDDWGLDTEKPPLGLIPKYHYEYQRLQDIIGAINRYLEAELEVPVIWLEEYNEIIEKRKNNAK